MRRRMIALLLGSVSALGLAAPPANALLGVGDVVIDPTNLIQNILTATHTLEQINNQIQQLQHEAQMLVNQAEDLKRLDYTSIEHLKHLLERIGLLMREAGEITYEVEQSERQYREAFPDSYEVLSNEEIVAEAADQWRISRDAFRASIQAQSGIVTSIADARETLTDLADESQAATGNLSVAQAGNQLVALGVEQQMQMQQLMAAQYRMETLETSRRAAIEEQARIRHKRFVGDGVAYSRD
ncbi:P-type conjugative transfer protein TrbJ [uncultured Hyphomonas sp.]|uniref:P-type conjugative transfer protein TrbJ n=1 Tax=uncultured Hyphomonas sp. TaxID=225298 RepID=UPI002AAB4213|nr:P-type conjugative transfer protein TrbJ [uncultured Hyphomonas sp.]